MDNEEAAGEIKHGRRNGAANQVKPSSGRRVPIVLDLVKSVLWKGADKKLEGLRLSHGWTYEVTSQVTR